MHYVINRESACRAKANLCASVCQTTLLTPEVTTAVTERHQGRATMFSLMFPTKKHKIMRLLLLLHDTNTTSVKRSGCSNTETNFTHSH